MANLTRLFFALGYLVGCPVHVYLGVTQGQTYRVFGQTVLLPPGRQLWAKVIMPHITVFALLLAAFERATGLLILARGRLVKLGFSVSTFFNFYLVIQWLGSPRANVVSGILTNRLVNLLFAALQVPLL